jgi:CRP-like cAMP-binding protein
MDSIELLTKNLLARVELTQVELDEILMHFKEKKLKKKQLIIQPDLVAKYRSYVVKGALRAFVVDDADIEHTIQFAVEDWWISDYNSYVHQTPATMFVEALEDSVIMQIDFQSEALLKKAKHVYETLFRIMAERSASFQQRRIISSLTQTAEQRYNDFLEKYPVVAQRIPQYALASYLGMTTGFLSKIRNDKVKKS